MGYKLAKPIDTNDLCEYGCNTQAKYVFVTSGKKCCSEHHNSCQTRKILHSTNAKKPQPTPINTDELCDYGCNTQAKYVFMHGKKCCSKHQNSCQGKRDKFSKLDHTERTSKSLATRTELGITKTSRTKAIQTMVENGTYQVMRKKMQEYWEHNHQHNHHQNNPYCLILPYKTLDLKYQGTYEFEFLEELESEHGLEWIQTNVKRGPSLKYIDPTDHNERLYISDFIIENTVYEIKSGWTWNKHGKDMALEQKNKAKLNACIEQGYNVILVLNQVRLKYDEKFVD